MNNDPQFPDVTIKDGEIVQINLQQMDLQIYFERREITEIVIPLPKGTVAIRPHEGKYMKAVLVEQNYGCNRP